MKYKVIINQSLFDIAVQETGDIENVFDILQSLENNSKVKQIGLTALPPAGTILKLEDNSNNVVEYYKNLSHEIATGMAKVCLLIDSENFVLKDSSGAILTVKCI